MELMDLQECINLGEGGPWIITLNSNQQCVQNLWEKAVTKDLLASVKDSVWKVLITKQKAWSWGIMGESRHKLHVKINLKTQPRSSCNLLPGLRRKDQRELKDLPKPFRLCWDQEAWEPLGASDSISVPVTTSMGFCLSILRFIPCSRAGWTTSHWREM